MCICMCVCVSASIHMCVDVPVFGFVCILFTSMLLVLVRKSLSGKIQRQEPSLSQDAAFVNVVSYLCLC